MKIHEKITALIIVLAIIMPFLSPIVLATENQETKYLALGDSIAYGYGLSNRDTQSYAQIVRQKQGISQSNFSNLAVSGMTCAQFYDKIQTTEYTNAIKDADLITVSIGSNELLKIAIAAVSDATGVDSSDPDFTTKVKEYFANAGYMTKMTTAYKLYNYFTSDSTKRIINQSIETYSDKWKKSVEYIKSINPDVTIVATQFYNPYYEVGLASYDLGSYADEFIKRMNVILDQQSNSEKEYKIARIYDDFNTTDPRITNVNVDFNDFSKFEIDPHPNKDGHSIIATRVLDVLKTVNINSKKDIKGLTFSNVKDCKYTGSEITPNIKIKDGNKALTENTDYTLTYLNNKDIGKASIIIKGIGNYTGTVTKTFNIKNVDTNNKTDISKLNITNIEDQTYVGIKITPDVEIKTSNNKVLVRNTDYSLRYYDNINVGTATIEITGIGNYRGTRKVTFKITPKEISTATVKDIPNQKYTGSEISPSVKITDGSAKLVNGTDYNLTYSNNTELGDATVTITGKGNYTGTTTKTFTISNEVEDTKTDIEDLTITDIEDKIYTGKVITPEVEIKNEDTVLIKDKDYELSYENNLNIGTGTLTITGIGDYTNTVTKNFNIVRKDINFTQIVDIPEQVYTGEEIEPELVITSDFIKLKEGEDYTVEYSENKEEGTATITIKGINNYTGTTVKTFNIISEEEKEEKNTNTISYNNSVLPSLSDNTLSTKVLPFAGMKTIIITLFIIIITSGTYSFIRYYRNRDIK